MELAGGAVSGGAVSGGDPPPAGALSGCDAHAAYSHVTEDNFFEYLHDSGDIFEPGYDAQTDADAQRGARRHVAAAAGLSALSSEPNCRTDKLAALTVSPPAFLPPVVCPNRTVLGRPRPAAARLG